MAVIESDQYWQSYLPGMRREFSELVLDILLAGGAAGAGALHVGSVFVDWDVFNQDALRWLDLFLGDLTPGLTQEGAYAWAKALNEATRRGVVQEIRRWVMAGDPLPELEKRLLPFFSEKRAHRVAVTEVTRAYAAGNVMAWKASGVVDGKIWQTAVDERVCPVCGKLHNKMVELDAGWEFTQAMLDSAPALRKAVRVPQTIAVPPAHVLCRCWLKPIVFEAMTPEEIAAVRWE